MSETVNIGPSWTNDPATWVSTPPLSIYMKFAEEDSNLFWRMESGHAQNLLEAAIEEIENLRAQVDRVRELHFDRPKHNWVARNCREARDLGYPISSGVECRACSEGELVCQACGEISPCQTRRALEES